MDALAGLLDGPRARAAFLVRMTWDPPFSLRIEDRSALTVMCVVSGSAWVVPQVGEAVRLGPGDVAVAAGPAPYTVADDPGTPPQAVILPGQVCQTLDGQNLAATLDLGVRSWGGSRDGAICMISGTYQEPGEVSQPLLRALPPLLVVPAGTWDSPLVGLLAAEIGRDEPGQEVVLDRLLDLLLIAVLRAWFARPEGRAPAWYAAQADPVVGPALRLLHDDPSHPWTVASLASAVGVSRAALARRFTRLVGEPPMAYLTAWRLALAADLLRGPDLTVEAAARRVGYGSSFALSTAFKRVRGVRPQEHRNVVAAG